MATETMKIEQWVLTEDDQISPYHMSSSERDALATRIVLPSSQFQSAPSGGVNVTINQVKVTPAEMSYRVTLNDNVVKHREEFSGFTVGEIGTPLVETTLEVVNDAIDHLKRNPMMDRLELNGFYEGDDETMEDIGSVSVVIPKTWVVIEAIVETKDN